MKRLYLGFGITALTVIVVGLIHGGIAWIVAEATWNPSGTSLPTWAAFFCLCLLPNSLLPAQSYCSKESKFQFIFVNNT